MSAGRLLVPTQVDALVMREEGGSFADCRMREPVRGGEPVQDLAGPLFGERTDPHPRGVHLHWALPDALTRVVQPEGEGPDEEEPPAADPPPIPDRWLVLRISPSPSAGKRTIAGWVLEAGLEPPGAGPPSVDGWSEPGTAAGPPLTAFGSGDPAWAAYYDNVGGRLGLYDSLTDIAAGPLAYLVCGWWSDPARDALDHPPIASLTDFYARLRELGWSLAEQLTGTEWPVSCLVHGAALAIGWPEPGVPGDDDGELTGEVGGPPAAEAVTVGFGETLAEVLGALLAPDEPLTARMLEGFQHGLLTGVDRPGGLAKLDAALHATRFGSAPTKSRTETIWQPENPVAELPAPAGDGRPGLAPDAPSGPGEVIRGGLHEALGVSGEEEPEQVDGEFLTVGRTRPRVFDPAEPVMMLKGPLRSFKHGADGRYAADGTLICRLPDDVVREVTGPELPAPVRGADLLDRPIGNPAVPEECQPLLEEAVLVDPGTALAAANHVPRAEGMSASAGEVERHARAYLRAQTDWWRAWDPRVDATEALARSPFVGTLPSPVALTAPARPWTPLHLDWAVELFPVPGGLEQWLLGEVDFRHPEPPGTTAGSGITVQGRARLTAAPATLAGSAARRTLAALAAAGGSGRVDPDVTHRFASAAAEALLGAVRPDVGEDRRTRAGGDGSVAGDLDNLDVLGGALEGFHARLRQEPEGQVVNSEAAVQPEPRAARPPEGFVALRAGFVRVTRLRLVDCYGQFVDLLGSSATEPADSAAVIKPPAAAVDGHPDLAVLPPRFTAPAQLLLRYHAASERDPREAAAGLSPVCGYLLPDRLDDAVEFLDAEGAGIGRLRPDPGAGTVWEEQPGRSSPLGQSPSRAIDNTFLGRIADGLLDWDAAAPPAEGAESALQAMLRLIDVTRFTVDPGGGAADEHLALLVGGPICVMRASLTLRVEDPVKPPENRSTAVPVRLGSLAHTDDGLLGYFVNDDYRSLRCIDPAAPELAPPSGPRRGFLSSRERAAAHGDRLRVEGAPAADPIEHPYVDRGGLVWVRPGDETWLTLLVVPNTKVHATPALLPRKDIGMRREWIADALAEMTPTFRFGPVLVDPETVRMPVAGDIRGSWTWHHRPEIAAWTSDAVVHAGPDAVLAPDPVEAQEGWLRLRPLPPAPLQPPTAIRIEAIATRARSNPRERIQAVGGRNRDGSWWRLSVEQVVQLLDSGRFGFHVEVPDHPRVEVIVARTASGRRYIKTRADRLNPNNLLSLPDLPPVTP